MAEVRETDNNKLLSRQATYGKLEGVPGQKIKDLRRSTVCAVPGSFSGGGFGRTKSEFPAFNPNRKGFKQSQSLLFDKVKIFGDSAKEKQAKKNLQNMNRSLSFRGLDLNFDSVIEQKMDKLREKIESRSKILHGHLKSEEKIYDVVFG